MIPRANPETTAVGQIGTRPQSRAKGPLADDHAAIPPVRTLPTARATCYKLFTSRVRRETAAPGWARGITFPAVRAGSSGVQQGAPRATPRAGAPGRRPPEAPRPGR